MRVLCEHLPLNHGVLAVCPLGGTIIDLALVPCVRDEVQLICYGDINVPASKAFGETCCYISAEESVEVIHPYD